MTQSIYTNGHIQKLLFYACCGASFHMVTPKQNAVTNNLLINKPERKVKGAQKQDES